MVLRFTGTSTHKVDGKGRVSIPAPFRRVLESNDPQWTEGRPVGLYITHADRRQPFVTVYTVDAMNDIYAQIDAMPRGIPQRRIMQDIYNANTTYMTVDDSGRLVLPQHIREHLKLDGECVFKSGGDTFQILRPEAAAPATEALEDFFADKPLDYDPAEMLSTFLPPGTEG